MLTEGGVITPSFDLKSNSKTGEVYFAARLATEDGYYIQTTSPYYNWGGAAAVYQKVNVLPNSKVAYNKAGKKNWSCSFLITRYQKRMERK